MAEKEYIAKEFVIDAIEELKTKPMPKALLFDHLTKLIEIFPAEDFAPVKHGHWESNEYLAGIHMTRCSECKTEFYIQDLEEISGDGFINFCPNCGARMDGGDNE